MSTFLQICQKVRQECGIAGESTPSTVLAQTGVLKKLVDRTARAWVDIQAGKPCWRFLRNQLTDFALTIGTSSYSVRTALGLSSVDKFDQKACFIYEVSTQDQTRLEWITYDSWRNRYPTIEDGRPTEVALGRDGTIVFNRSPDKAYVINFDYYMTPELLAANADVPSLPEQYHDVIVWKSVMMFCGAETASDLYSYAKSMYSSIYHQLCMDQLDLPGLRMDFPTAQGNRNVSSWGPRRRGM